MQQFLEAQELEEQALREIKTRLCQRFDDGYEEWSVYCVNGKLAQWLMRLALGYNSSKPLRRLIV